MTDDNQNNEGALKKSIHAGKWVFLNTIVQKVFFLGSFFILARLLTPEDFGIVALLFIVPTLLDLVTNFGFEIALIQSKEDTTPYLNVAWTLGIVRALAIFLTVFFSAPLIAGFFHIEKAILAVRLSGIFILIGGFANVAQLFFFKDIDFKKIFIRDMVGAFCYASVSIGFAIFYRSFWPLFFGNIAQWLSGSLITYALHNFRPRLSFEFGKLKNLIGYSKWIFGQNLILNAIPLLENGLTGKWVNPTAVGLYSKAKSLAVTPLSPLYNILDRVTFPAYSKIQDNYEKIRDGFIKSLDLLFFIAAPFILLFLQAGHRIILILLGEKWIGLEALLKFLLLGVTFNTLIVLTGPIFNAVGKPRIQFYINFINIIVIVFLFLLLIPAHGAIGAAIALLINSVIIFLISFYNLVKILNIKIIEIIKPLLIPLISSLFALGAGKITLFLAGAGAVGNIEFIALIAFAGTIYGALIVLSGISLKAGPYATIRLVISEILQYKNGHC